MQVIVDDIDTEYRDVGFGPLVLLLHGWGGDAFSFNSLTEELKGKRCISFSFPGFGKSGAPTGSWGVFEYAKFLTAFLKKLNLPAVDTVIAHSFGGRVAIKAIARGILFPKKLVLIGAAGVSQKTISQRCLFAVTAFGKMIISLIPSVSIQRWLTSCVACAIGSEDYCNAGSLKDTFVKIVNEDLRGDASNIKTPTLLIWGDQDRQTPISDARVLQSCIQCSQLKIIEGAGHFVFTTEIKRVANMINAFV